MSVDLNDLLSYSLQINFSPLQSFLTSQTEKLRALEETLANLPAPAPPPPSDVPPGVPDSVLQELRDRLSLLGSRIDALPPPHMFSWDDERAAMLAAERLALEAASAAAVAKGSAMDAAGEAISAGEDARKAAAVAAAAAMEMRNMKFPAPPPPVTPLNLSKVEDRLSALEAAASGGSVKDAAALAQTALEEARAARSEAKAALEEARAAREESKSDSAALKSRLDALEFSVTQLKVQVGTLNAQMENVLAAPPPPPTTLLDPNASAGEQAAAALGALRAEVAQLKGSLPKLKGELEGSIAGLGSRVEVLEGAATAGGAPPASALADLTAALGKVEKDCAALAGRVGGTESTMATFSKDVRDVRNALELMKVTVAELAGRPSGGGGGGVGMPPELMDAIHNILSHTTQTLGVKVGLGGGGGGSGGGVEGGDAAAASHHHHHHGDSSSATTDATSKGNSHSWRGLVDKTREVLRNARPVAHMSDVRALERAMIELTRVVKEQGEAHADKEARLVHLLALVESLAPRVPPAGAMATLASTDARLGEVKADRTELEAVEEAMRSAMGALGSRLGDITKTLSALALRVDSSGGDSVSNAAATGRQLLRDLYCLSCSRPTPAQNTDRGPFTPTAILEPHTLVSARFVHGHSRTAEESSEQHHHHQHHQQQQQQQQHSTASYSHFAGGGGGGSEAGLPPQHAPYNPNLTNLSPTGGFQVLPNGQVLGKLGLRAASGRPVPGVGGAGGGGGPGGGMDMNAGSLGAYVAIAATLGGAGVVTQSPNRMGGMATTRPLPPIQYPPGSPSATGRSASDQGLPSKSIARVGGGIPVMGGGSVTAVASPTVDPVTGQVVPHFYADESVLEHKDQVAIVTHRQQQHGGEIATGAVQESKTE